jgi:hypothetical protein
MALYCLNGQGGKVTGGCRQKNVFVNTAERSTSPFLNYIRGQNDFRFSGAKKIQSPAVAQKN